METEFFQTCWWGNSPRGKKTFEKSARGRENNKNLKIQKRRTGKFEIPTTTRNLVGRANFPQIEEEEDGYYKYQTNSTRREISKKVPVYVETGIKETGPTTLISLVKIWHKFEIGANN
jgi:hypothetical protein